MGDILLIRPQPEIILFGDEAGVDQIRQELGLRHVPDVARNEYGTPLLNDIFEKAQKLASYDLLCYVNADTIVMSDFLKALEETKAWHDRFCLAGARRDAQITRALDFSDYDWETKVRGLTKDHYLKIGIEYFVFPRGALIENSRLPKSPL